MHVTGLIKNKLKTYKRVNMIKNDPYILAAAGYPLISFKSSNDRALT